MSLVVIRATFECDGCGTQFKVDMKPEAMRPKGWSLFDEAMDYLRGGCGADGGMPAIVHDMHLCDDCAKIAASVDPESKNEILEAIERGPHKAKNSKKRVEFTNRKHQR